MEKPAQTPETKPQEQPLERDPNACRFCGFITPFDPKVPGFCCPFCGGPSGE